MDLTKYYGKLTLDRARFINHAVCDTIAAPSALMWSNPAELEGFDREMFDELATAAMLKLLGQEGSDDPDEWLEMFNNLETRTARMVNAATSEAGRIYRESMWLRAAIALEPYMREVTMNYAAPDKPGTTNAVLLYFFASHKEINPVSEEDLTDKQITELRNIYDHARKCFEKSANAQWEKFIRYELPHSEYKPAKYSSKPVDPLTKKLYSGTAPKKGELTVRDTIPTSKRGVNDSAAIAYMVDFTQLKRQGINVTMEITPFDERVLMAADALYNEKDEGCFSLSELFRTMGNTGDPSDEQRKRIDDSIVKQMFTAIYINNRAEIDNGYDYPLSEYRGYFLPGECRDSYIGGHYIETTYRLYREPEIITFAKGRGQYTTLPVELFKVPGRKTDVNIAIENYLLTRIAQAKNELHRLQAARKSEEVKKALAKAESETILLATVLEAAQIIEREQQGRSKAELAAIRKQRERSRAKVAAILEHYKRCKWIAGYTMESDRAIIDLE